MDNPPKRSRYNTPQKLDTLLRLDFLGKASILMVEIHRRDAEFAEASPRRKKMKSQLRFLSLLQ